MRTFVQQLESRCLLSFAPFGETGVAKAEAEGNARGSDVAVAGDGSYLIASLVINDTTETISATRYSNAGEVLGAPIAVASIPHRGKSRSPYFSEVRASMDRIGYAVGAYHIHTKDVESDSGSAVKGQIYFALISRTGKVSGATLLVDGYVSDPAVSMDAKGGF